MTADDHSACLPLFIYGSLRDPAIRARLLGARPDLTTCPAVLHGHTRQTLPSFGYPFVIPAERDARVDGDLLLGLGAADYAILDDYEDVDHGLYLRAAVTVETPSGPVTAQVYRRGPAAPPAVSPDAPRRS